MYNMFNSFHSPIKYTSVTFSFQFHTASGRYIGKIYKSAPIFSQNHTSQLAIYRPQSKFKFPPSYHPNLPFKHI